MNTLLHVTLVWSILTFSAALETPSSADFIIVGAGTAGSVLAGRLCALLPKAEVLLLERGTPRNETTEFLVRASRNAFDAQASPLLVDNYQSLPNPGLNNQTREILSGKTLGGSSAVNGQQFTIPIGKTVERWNIKGLSTKLALKYYQRAFDTLGIAQPPESLRIIYARQYKQAAKMAGFRESPGQFDQSNSLRIWDNRVAADKAGRKVDSYTAYVKPVLHGKCKERLRVMQGVTVTRIVLSKGSKKRAIGIEYIPSTANTSRKRIFVKARREVLVSAGPFESPKLLQLSGIGPPSVLRKAGVKVLVKLPVGRRSQARAAANFISRYEGVPLEPANNATMLQSEEAVEMFKRGEGGVYGTAVGSVNAVIQRLGYLVTFSVFRQGSSFFNEPIILSSCVGNPKSFGFVRIKDSSPFSVPKVHTNVLGEKADLDDLLKCMKKVEGIHKNLPKEFQLASVSPLGKLDENFLRDTSIHGYHFVGGCPIDGVVANNLKVFGVKHLRVIDASTLKRMPVSAGPMASVYMLAEYASEKISEMYPCLQRGRKKCRLGLSLRW